MIRQTLSVTALFSFLFLAAHATAVEYSRFAFGSGTILDGLQTVNGITARGQNHLFEDDLGIAGGYAAVPFSFAPRDFSLSQLDSISSIELELVPQPSDAEDGFDIEIFFAADSREDLGFSYLTETATCDWGHNGGEFGEGWPARCYDMTYNADIDNGIDPEDFNQAPVSLGVYEVDLFSPLNVLELEIGEIESSLLSQINADEEFHLLIAPPDDTTFLRLEDSLNVKPRMTIDASGEAAAGVTKELIRQNAIHTSNAEIFNSDFYGSGNDDLFSEYGIAGWQFSKDDFGVTDDVSTIGSVQLILAHNDRSFSDGAEVEFFFVSDTAEELGVDDVVGTGEYALTYNESLENGIDEEQYDNAPISLGKHPYEPKLGSRREVFDLEISEEVEELLAEAINEDKDFQIIIAAPEPDSDITFSGLNNFFDPGNPQLTISLEASDTPDPTCTVPEGALLADLDGDGTVATRDFLIISRNFNKTDLSYEEGDINCDGVVNVGDFLTLSRNFGRSAGATNATAAVPEPAGWLTGMIGLLLAGILRRRR